ncbi:NAD(P)H-dependent oxidoreductase subunit E [Altericroceibacterium xinjiangense]|uniref:NAD(P)H-dependent oxidoreductase subunit E n=1 Tax=Altericroceibacterium xinjiangense TaxID=762261 RepID=UPI000F7F1356|nr:NAD(P)H-dependent oxidoreductase subunit E [Altericroceibacterium xinjiangense]
MSKELRIGEIVAGHFHREGPLLPILHEVQEEFGCVDAESEALIAKALNWSRADVHGVVSFYHDFLANPDPRPEVQICRAEACKARGIESMMDEAQQAAGDRVKLSAVYCLGLCSAGPAARMGETLHARLDTGSLASLIENA